MTTIEQMISRVEDLKIPELVDLSIEATEIDFRNINAEQMFAGVNRDGSPIQPDYTARTKAIKASKGQPFDRVTLRDTGEFQKRIEARLDGSIIRIFSTDEKTEKLEEKYGSDIFGLGGEFKDKYVEIVRPEFENQGKKALLL